MSIKNNCSVCGKLYYCKKLAGVCKECRGDKRWSGDARAKARRDYGKRQRNKMATGSE